MAGGWVLKHRLPVSTPDLLSWAPTGGLGLFPWVTVKPVVTQTSGLFHAVAIGELLGLVSSGVAPICGVTWDTP